MAAAVTNSLDTDGHKEAVLRFMRIVDAQDFESLDAALAPDLQFHVAGPTLIDARLKIWSACSTAPFPTSIT